MSAALSPQPHAPHSLTRAATAPVWYASYRFYLTAIVGGSILFSRAYCLSASCLATQRGRSPLYLAFLTVGSLSYYDVRDQSLIHTHAEVTQGLNTGATRMSQKKIDDLPVSFKPKAGGSFGVLTAKKSAEEEEEEEAEKEAVVRPFPSSLPCRSLVRARLLTQAYPRTGQEARGEGRPPEGVDP